MNIYDFDNTIYKGDTGVDILLYSLKKMPFKVIKSAFKALRVKLKGEIYDRVKEQLFSFLFSIDNLDDYIEKYVNLHMKNIKQWYLEQQKETDIVISASYELWIKVFCEKLGIKNVIATKTNNKGYLIGKNCKNKEKINRLKKEFPNIKVDEAYSDSAVDIPMLEFATKGYVVKGNELILYKKGCKFPHKL